MEKNFLELMQTFALSVGISFKDMIINYQIYIQTYFILLQALIRQIPMKWSTIRATIETPYFTTYILVIVIQIKIFYKLTMNKIN